MNEALRQITKRSKCYDEADFFPSIFGELHQQVVTGALPVVLFGAGSAGMHLCNALKIHNVEVNCFCDNDRKMVGGLCAGRPIISVDELRRKCRGCLIVIATSDLYVQQIRDQLLGLGFRPKDIHSPPPDYVLYYTNAVNLYWTADDLKTYAGEIQETYDLFADIKSRDLFVSRMSLLTGGLDYNSFKNFVHFFADLVSECSRDFFLRPRYDENFFYFNSDFFPLVEGEVFANVGALTGDCAIEFADACRNKGLKYRQIINFEPDPHNFLKLSQNLNHLPNVTSLQCGLWSRQSHLRFSNPNKIGSFTPGRLDNGGDIKVDVASLDELLPDTEISLMKMDVEGAELEALRGASNTIKRDKPKLAISLYHKRNDIFEIPLLLRKLNPEYKFYLRHHSTTFGETILFAIS